MIIQICAWCQSTMDKEGNPKRKITSRFKDWVHRLGGQFSHSICSTCRKDYK